jgi:O-methyltransferase involved in polyketide biosynthesis
VAADLEEQNLAKRLDENGLDREAAAFCSVLGVTQYLTRGALEALFRFAASLPDQSEIVFSFALPDDELEGAERAAAVNSMAFVETIGGPWITRLRPAEAFGLLMGLGFGDVFHLTPKRAQKRYFGRRDDGLRAPQPEQLVAATV